MPWVRLDDEFATHRVIKGLTDAAFRLHVEALCWCSTNTTDGHIRGVELQQIDLRPRAKKAAAELVNAGRWHTRGHACPKCPQPTDGWIIHDYLEFQFSRERILADRAAAAERQRRWLEKHQGRKTARDGPKDTSLTASQVASQTPLVTPSLTPPPSPPLPAPKGKRGGDLPEAPAARRQAADRGDDGRSENQTLAGHPPSSSNGRPAPAARPPDLADLRKTLATAASKRRTDGRRLGVMNELRALTDPPADPPGDTDATDDEPTDPVTDQ